MTAATHTIVCSASHTSMIDRNLSCVAENLSRHLITPGYWQASPSLATWGIISGLSQLIFLLIGLPSNLLIILYILLKKLYRQSTYLLLTSLAASDVLMCAIVMPLIVVAGFAGEFVLGSSDYARCKVCQTGVCLVASTLSSLHIIALMSLDRFIFIKYPLRYDGIVTPGRTAALITTLCLLSCLLAILPLFGVGDIYFDHPTFSCSPKLDQSTPITQNIHYMIAMVAVAMLPISVLAVTNVWVIYIAWKQIREIYRIKRSIGNRDQADAYHESLRTRMQQTKYRKQLQLLRVFGAIFIAHMFTWIPYIVRTIEVLITGSDEFSPWSNYIILVSITSHPVLHPILEACILPELRRNLTVCCSQCKFKQPASPKSVGTGTVSINNDSPVSNCHESCYGTCMDNINVVVLPGNEIAATV